LIMQFGPWVLGALGLLAGFIRHTRAKPATAEAKQKVAEAQAATEQAKTQTAEVRDGEAHVNAAAARAGAEASKERAHVENDVAAMPFAPLLTSCATNGADLAKTPAAEPLVQVKTRFVDTACDWTKPIYVSSTDVLSDETAKAILAHSRAGAAQCGWKPTGR
jgi:hypothetical protein